MSYSAPNTAPGRIDRPIRRAEPLHPAALLVDQDRRIRLADGFPQFANKHERLAPDVSMFRLNRMKPHGRSARMNSRSAALSSGPDTPVMKARVLMRAD